MKGLFIPEITAEMFRSGCLESIEALMAEGEIYDIDYQQPCEDAISKKSVIEWLKDKDIIKTKNQEENARRELAALSSVTPSYNSIKTELKPSGDCISREALIEKATSWDKHFADSERCVSLTDIQNAPSITPQPNIDEIIKQIEEARDKDQIAEYPYNRCIKIIREVLGDD